jgi:hypothetical protein
VDNLPSEEEERRFPHLTAMQEAFVANFIADPRDAKAAAIMAGYSETSAAVTACRMLRNPPIMQAIVESTALRLGASGARAAARLDALIDNAKSEYVQLEASKDVLNRIGATAPKRISVSGAVSIEIDLGE